jgi:bacteriocin-like protein
MTMTISTTETLAASLAKHELSTDELETVTGGTTIMSGVRIR